MGQPVLIAFDWTNVHLAGAFIIGSVFGTIATLRIVRYVAAYFSRRGGDEDPPP